MDIRIVKPATTAAAPVRSRWAEFLYAAKLAPTFPSWLIDGTKPSQLAWYLKERILPPLYWQAMLRGREWMVRPQLLG